MKKTALNFLLLLFAALVMALAIWGPEAISGYRDKSVLNEIHVKDGEGECEGYRYSLSRSDKLFILARRFPRANRMPGRGRRLPVKPTERRRERMRLSSITEVRPIVRSKRRSCLGS